MRNVLRSRPLLVFEPNLIRLSAFIHVGTASVAAITVRLILDVMHERRQIIRIVATLVSDLGSGLFRRIKNVLGVVERFIASKSFHERVGRDRPPLFLVPL